MSSFGGYYEEIDGGCSTTTSPGSIIEIQRVTIISSLDSVSTGTCAVRLDAQFSLGRRRNLELVICNVKIATVVAKEVAGIVSPNNIRSISNDLTILNGYLCASNSAIIITQSICGTAASTDDQIIFASSNTIGIQLIGITGGRSFGIGAAATTVAIFFEFNCSCVAGGTNREQICVVSQPHLFCCTVGTTLIVRCVGTLQLASIATGTADPHILGSIQLQNAVITSSGILGIGSIQVLTVLHDVVTTIGFHLGPQHVGRNFHAFSVLNAAKAGVVKFLAARRTSVLVTFTFLRGQNVTIGNNQVLIAGRSLGLFATGLIGSGALCNDIQVDGCRVFVTTTGTSHFDGRSASCQTLDGDRSACTRCQSEGSAGSDLCVGIVDGNCIGLRIARTTVSQVDGQFLADFNRSACGSTAILGLLRGDVNVFSGYLIAGTAFVVVTTVIGVVTQCNGNRSFGLSTIFGVIGKGNLVAVDLSNQTLAIDRGTTVAVLAITHAASRQISELKFLRVSAVLANSQLGARLINGIIVGIGVSMIVTPQEDNIGVIIQNVEQSLSISAVSA